LKYDVTAYDILPSNVEWANQSKKRYFSTTIGKLNFTSDIAELKPIDIVFSQGLLEHFDDQKIIEIINAQLAFANRAVLFSVPSEEYKNQDYGDERLMSVAEWEAILSPVYGDKLYELYRYDQKRFIMGVITSKGVTAK
jgi:hypothetical protein